MKKFLISSAGIVVILIFAVGYGHFFGLKNLSGYDIIVKTRTDLGHNIDTLKGFLQNKVIEKDTLYILKDGL